MLATAARQAEQQAELPRRGPRGPVALPVARAAIIEVAGGGGGREHLERGGGGPAVEWRADLEASFRGRAGAETEVHFANLPPQRGGVRLGGASKLVCGGEGWRAKLAPSPHAPREP